MSTNGQPDKLRDEMDVETSSGSSEATGSRSGYRLHARQHDHQDDDGQYDVDHAGATEATGLLDVGARTGARQHDSSPRNDSWVGLKAFEGLPWWKTPSVWWLLFPYALFTLAFGGSAVPKLNLMIDLICNQYFADKSAHDPDFTFIPVLLGDDNPQCRHIPEVLRRVATFSLMVSVMTGILSSLTAPKLGAMSDRYGRKRMLVICSFGGIVGEVITILAAKYPETVHYNWLLLGAFCDGLLGSFTAGSVLIHSYTSDCTPPSQRGVAIGYLHSCLFTGLAFGPLLAGYFVEWMHSLLSIFYVTLACHVFFILFVASVIPESLSKSHQIRAREKHAAKVRVQGPVPEWAASVASKVPFGKYFGESMRSIKTANPLAPLDILFPKGPGAKKLRRNLLTLAAIDTSILGAAMSTGGVIVLYTQDKFGWGNLESSQFISLVSMVRVVVLLGIFPAINYIFRIRPEARRRRETGVALVERNAGADKLDIWILRTALLSDVIGVIGYVFVRNSALFVTCAVITAFGGLGSATISASLTKHVPAERVGQLLGAIGLLHALSRIVAPILFNGLYAATVKVYPQAFFVLLAAVFVAALGAAFIVRPGVYMEDDYEPLPVPSSQEAESSTSVRAAQDRLEDEEVLPVIS
ncbi:major facilitator superfamily domain-containing protein [Apodospora peruviana]|uniref:Major facilitator superfamily domain-containing protein n=1 Tax=Apodospora peruviana TaxID=516989 RepID=A0AAE0M4J2_9PEZI|nr:major facilitator superfamily domain-containing protein [Apodospora peruviana]